MLPIQLTRNNINNTFVFNFMGSKLFIAIHGTAVHITPDEFSETTQLNIMHFVEIDSNYSYLLEWPFPKRDNSWPEHHFVSVASHYYCFLYPKERRLLTNDHMCHFLWYFWTGLTVYKIIPMWTYFLEIKILNYLSLIITTDLKYKENNYIWAKCYFLPNGSFQKDHIIIFTTCSDRGPVIDFRTKNVANYNSYLALFHKVGRVGKYHIVLWYLHFTVVQSVLINEGLPRWHIVWGCGCYYVIVTMLNISRYV